MDDVSRTEHVQCVIVHDSLIVLQDLKETLIAEGASQVISAPTLDDAPLLAPAVALVSGHLADVFEHPKVAAWTRSGASVIIINGGAMTQVNCPPGFFVLEQPFTSDDVAQTLRLTGAF